MGRPERWDLPFSDTIDDRVADELLACLPFSKLDPANFPRNLPLRGLLRNDCRIVDLADGEFVVRAGDYGNSAFFILEGAVQVVLDPLPAAALGRAPVRRARGGHRLLGSPSCVGWEKFPSRAPTRPPRSGIFHSQISHTC